LAVDGGGTSDSLALGMWAGGHCLRLDMVMFALAGMHKRTNAE
jgi:hypothetical protein